MEAFREVYEAWRREPFPSGGANDELGELHADVALADSWVAEAVIPFVERGSFVPGEVNVLQELRTMRDRAARLHDPAATSVYLRYIDLLSSVYAAFLRAGGQNPSASLPG